MAGQTMATVGSPAPSPRGKATDGPTQCQKHDKIAT